MYVYIKGLARISYARIAESLTTPGKVVLLPRQCGMLPNANAALLP